MRIAAKRVSKKYGADASSVRALDGATFRIEAGEFVAIMGRSGSGKSTLMNLLGLLDRPSSGTLSLDGIAVENLSSDRLAKIRNARIGFIFQSYQLLPRCSALDNVLLPLMYRRVPLRQARRKAIETLEAMGVGHRLNHRPTQLSGGEQQRVAIARALVRGPRLILADEPTGALDVDTGASVMALLDEVAESSGAALITITHDVNVAALARRHYRLDVGVLTEIDAPAHAVSGAGAPHTAETP
jgi:putative ABC transport system ATP-binding protein